MEKENKLAAVLRGRGISDPYKFLEQRGKSAKIGKSSDPDVRVRGNVQLMKGRKVTRADVANGFSLLKHL